MLHFYSASYSRISCLNIVLSVIRRCLLFVFVLFQAPFLYRIQHRTWISSYVHKHLYFIYIDFIIYFDPCVKWSPQCIFFKGDLAVSDSSSTTYEYHCISTPDINMYCCSISVSIIITVNSTSYCFNFQLDVNNIHPDCVISVFVCVSF